MEKPYDKQFGECSINYVCAVRVRFRAVIKTKGGWAIRLQFESFFRHKFRVAVSNVTRYGDTTFSKVICLLSAGLNGSCLYMFIL